LFFEFVEYVLCGSGVGCPDMLERVPGGVEFVHDLNNIWVVAKFDMCGITGEEYSYFLHLLFHPYGFVEYLFYLVLDEAVVKGIVM
jgi:hypothetical protein